MKNHAIKMITLYDEGTDFVNTFQSVALFFARVYVAWIFFAAGLTKLKDWESTLFLFEEEYNVPFISFELAAYLGTTGEILLPIILMLGLASRFGALGLTFVNIIAVISLEEIATAALYAHIIWGLLLLQIVLFGAGKLSIDNLIKHKIKGY